MLRTEPRACTLALNSFPSYQILFLYIYTELVIQLNIDRSAAVMVSMSIIISFWERICCIEENCCVKENAFCKQAKCLLNSTSIVVILMLGKNKNLDRVATSHQVLEYFVDNEATYF